ncbi:Magnetosome protein MamF [Rhodovastum atsumiense]|uniref:DUF4870 domain-containing protein n=1 Tax=Rhodovastum atsumiense TaxID=504468 RepID=A0A5M6IK00_9PROT|nr:hypothetical protein [Rhodovastum atsumiense]KAA5608015.1 hypothetical protein F1189_31045 [Rhodovastum atsumiense]CAH2598658.1 Magnetosome protein MamF [Rhodovastum atsumiense]
MIPGEEDAEPTAATRPILLAIMSYLGILCFIPLLFGNRSPFVQFHARQGLVIWAWGVLALMALSLPGFGGWFFHFSANLILILSVAGVISVLLGKTWKFPLIYDLAAKL